MARFHAHALLRFAQRRLDLFPTEESRMNREYVREEADKSCDNGVLISRADMEEFLGHKIRARYGDWFYRLDQAAAGVWVMALMPSGAHRAVTYLTRYFPIDDEVEAAMEALLGRDLVG